jgi:hypothetical protein
MTDWRPPTVELRTPKKSAVGELEQRLCVPDAAQPREREAEGDVERARSVRRERDIAIESERECERRRCLHRRLHHRRGDERSFGRFTCRGVTGSAHSSRPPRHQRHRRPSRAVSASAVPRGDVEGHH